MNRKLLYILALLLMVTQGAWATVAVNGKLPGAFSVSATKQVWFSQGNLQYQAGNKLTYPTSTGNINGFRAYFKLKGTAAATARSFAMSFEDETTGINPIHNAQFIMHNEYYDLQGRKIANGQKPKAKGLYIVNGRKVVVK